MLLRLALQYLLRTMESSKTAEISFLPRMTVHILLMIGADRCLPYLIVRLKCMVDLMTAVHLDGQFLLP